jgi:hypothetical protein
VVVAGLDAAVVVEVAGLDAVVGAFGAGDGLWATAREAVAAKTIADLSRVVGLMVEGV